MVSIRVGGGLDFVCRVLLSYCSESISQYQKNARSLRPESLRTEPTASSDACGLFIFEEAR